MSRKIIMTSEGIRRTLARIAHEIIEQNKSSEHLILVGIHTRGVPRSFGQTRRSPGERTGELGHLSTDPIALSLHLPPGHQ